MTGEDEMKDCVIDCCGGVCTLADLSLAGEKEWRADLQAAKTAAKAAAIKAKQDAIKAKEAAQKEREQPADGSCGNCYNACHKINPSNKNCRKVSSFYYQLCPGACGREPVFKADGTKTCQGDHSEDRCPPIQPPPKPCTVEMFSEENFGGEVVRLEVTPSCPGGQPEDYHGKAACMYDAYKLKAAWNDMGNKVDSVKTSGHCQKVVLVDDDLFGDDKCNKYSDDNVVLEGATSDSDIKWDVSEDVCKVYVIPR